MEQDINLYHRHGTKTKRQKQLASFLFFILALLYFGFYLVGIISPDLLIHPVINAIPLSFVAGAVIIVASMTMTFIYAFTANRIDKKKDM